MPQFIQIALNELGFLVLHLTAGKLFKSHYIDSDGNRLPVAHLNLHMATSHSFSPSRQRLLLTSTAL